jgi:methanethiol S-methyltransferase
MSISFLIILLGCAFYGGLHSFLASLGAKAWAARRFGERGQRAYRLAFNLLAGLTFLPLMGLAWRLPDAAIYAVPWPWLGLTLAGQAAAALALLAGVSQTGGLAFLGLDALSGPRQDDPGAPAGAAPHRLVTGGLYRWVRHPLYTAGLAFLWLTPRMTWNPLALAVGLTAYILIGIYFEERKLLREFGPAYAAYRARTPMLIPIRFRRSG